MNGVVSIRQNLHLNSDFTCIFVVFFPSEINLPKNTIFFFVFTIVVFLVLLWKGFYGLGGLAYKVFVKKMKYVITTNFNRNYLIIIID